jgi:GTP cyclohydrolase II
MNDGKTSRVSKIDRISKTEKKPRVSPPHNEVPRGNKEKLLAKLTDEPDFILGEYYCQSAGTCDDKEDCVVLVARTTLPTRFGTFTMYGFYDCREKKEHTVIVQGDVEGTEHCPVRVHSECHTGDVWGSLRCDCREQLEASVRYIASRPFGVVIYLKQEGRGIGLLNKIKAYQLQDLGLDTIEANEFLGFPPDARDYRVAAQIIEQLKITSVALLTNNPDKIEQLSHVGVNVTSRIPVVIESNPFNSAYLETKRVKMGHIL